MLWMAQVATQHLETPLKLFQIYFKVDKKKFDFLCCVDDSVLQQSAEQLVTDRMVREGQQKTKKRKSTTSLAELAVSM